MTALSTKSAMNLKKCKLSTHLGFCANVHPQLFCPLGCDRIDFNDFKCHSPPLMQRTVLCRPVSHVAEHLYWIAQYSYFIFNVNTLCLHPGEKMLTSNQRVNTLPAALKSGSKVFGTFLTDWHWWQRLAWIQPVIMESNGDPFSLWENHNHCWNQLLVTELKLTQSCCSPSMRKLQTSFFLFLWPPFEAAGGVFYQQMVDFVWSITCGSGCVRPYEFNPLRLHWAGQWKS